MLYYLIMDTSKKIGDKIKEIRKKKKLTQVEVAQKAGIHFNYFARLERGEVNPSIQTIESIANALKVKSGDILFF